MKFFKASAVILLIAAIGVFAVQAMDSGTAPDDETAARAQWIRDNGIPIRTVDPKDEDFSDLMPLVDKIGSARMVLLGEQTHGDGPVLEMKSRMVKFLHEVMGFNVLAWESGLYDLREVEAALHTDMPLLDAISKGVFSIWGKTEQVQELFSYARKTHSTINPLIMAGFDEQFSSASARISMPQKLIAFLESSGKEILTQEEKDLLVNSFTPEWLKQLSEEDQSKYSGQFKELIGGLQNRIESHRQSLLKANSRGEVSFWLRMAKNLVAQQRQSELMAARKDPNDRENMRALTNTRDRAMGETLHWLAEEAYPGEKIIVWAASMHTARRSQEIFGLGRVSREKYYWYEGIWNMGHWIYQAMGPETYNITFIANKGKYGQHFAKQLMTLDPGPEGSLEYYLHQADADIMFLDLASTAGQPDHWIRGDLLARPMGYAEMYASWPRIFDAVIFMENMSPATRVNTENK